MQWLEMTLVGSTATSKRCGDHSITVNLDQVTDEYSCENCRRQWCYLQNIWSDKCSCQSQALVLSQFHCHRQTWWLPSYMNNVNSPPFP